MQGRERVDPGRVHELVEVDPLVHLMRNVPVAGPHGYDRNPLEGPEEGPVGGAGNAGVQISTALASGTEFQPVAFIDDNPALQGNYIEGYRVYPFRRLSGLIEDYEVKEVLMAMNWLKSCEYLMDCNLTLLLDNVLTYR